MMVAIYAAMSLALVFGWLNRRAPALICLLGCLGLAIWLFMFEIYSPEYGFRMPWIQTELAVPPSVDGMA